MNKKINQIVYKFLTRLSKREKLILYITVLILSVTILDRLVLSPLFCRMAILNKEIKARKATIARYMNIVAYEGRILEQNKKYSSFLVKSGSKEEETTKLLKEAETLASKNSVYLIDMKPKSPKIVNYLKKYSIDLNCEAQMEQLISFMYDIENSKKLLFIESFRISPKQRGSSIAVCTMNITQTFLSEE